ncbi:MAG: M48 family metalloprotease [Erythrobacter sp.]
MARNSRKIWALYAAPLALMGGISVVAAQPAAPTSITQKEAQLGAQYHPTLLAEYGGAMTGPQAQYVEQLGKRIALQSGLSNAENAFTVTLLNSPVRNAFAVPGGYIYSTRQLVALMNSEAELAAVLGHEVGHVAAGHWRERQKATRRNSLFGAGGAILSGILFGNSDIGRLGQQLATQGSQLWTLRFSRKQEHEADDLGMLYLGRAGYDRRAMSTVLASLAAQTELDARIEGRNASVPEWASTHPNIADRVVRMQSQAQAAGTGGVTNRDAFLSRIDGMLYGDDPAQGVIEGSRFIHPQLMLSFTAPQGFIMANSARSVSVQGQGGQAELTLASYNGDLEGYLRQQFAAAGGQNSNLAPQQVERTTVNGLPAIYGVARTNSGQRQVDVVVFAYEFARDRAYHFTAIAPAGQAATFNPMFQSMRRITDAEARNVVARRLQIVTVARGDTVASLAQRMAYPSGQEERFRVLNALGSNDSVVPGQRVKLVVRAR